jgi:Mg-chelatase subunit ChlD
MTARLSLIIAWTVVAGSVETVGTAGPVQDRPPQSTFRSGASGVAVDVAVRDRSRRPITNLTAADFEVTDNGVRQEVASVTYGKLPIDVTVGLDVSYSVTGALLDRLRQGVIGLMRDLSPQDRLKLVLFNARVARAVDFTADPRAVERAIRTAQAGGGTALFDAISVALVSHAPTDRRQLLVFFTDGRDSSSTTTPDVLLRVAAQTRPTLTFVMPGLASSIFRVLTAETGGSILPITIASDLSSVFRRALDEFRSAYVLYYNARGVDPGGYHAIEVRVKRPGATIQARRGYFSSSSR